MPNARRPGTLAEVVSRAASDEQALTVALHEFLDEFYLDSNQASRARRIEGEPALPGHSETDAYIGAVGEHLARRWRLGEPPRWTDRKARFLAKPWFPPGTDQEKSFLLAESPLAFRRRMLFVSAEPLRRARMPRDERWYALEEARTGLNLRPSGYSEIR